MRNLYKSGQTVRYQNTGSVTIPAGAVVLFNSVPGIAVSPIYAGETGLLAISNAIYRFATPGLARNLDAGIPVFLPEGIAFSTGSNFLFEYADGARLIGVLSESANAGAVRVCIALQHPEAQQPVNEITASEKAYNDAVIAVDDLPAANVALDGKFYMIKKAVAPVAHADALIGKKFIVSIVDDVEIGNKVNGAYIFNAASNRFENAILNTWIDGATGLAKIHDLSGALIILYMLSADGGTYPLPPEENVEDATVTENSNGIDLGVNDTWSFYLESTTVPEIPEVIGIAAGSLFKCVAAGEGYAWQLLPRLTPVRVLEGEDITIEPNGYYQWSITGTENILNVSAAFAAGFYGEARIDITIAAGASFAGGTGVTIGDAQTAEKINHYLVEVVDGAARLALRYTEDLPA